MKYALLAIALLATTTAQADYAQRKTHDPRINQHQYDQHQRVKQGARSGALTKDEAKSLAQEQKSIRQQEHQYKSDGQLTQQERQSLRQQQISASKDIYSAKHNDVTRTTGAASQPAQ